MKKNFTELSLTELIGENNVVTASQAKKLKQENVEEAYKFRLSTLFANIKDKDYNSMFPVTCDVITIAAVNLNKEHIDGADTLDDYQTTMFEKMDALFRAALENKCDNIILGAWGCGVFKNDPREVAKIFNVTTFVYRKYFKNIFFAVINDKNSVDNNYKIFSETIKQTETE